MTFFFKRYMDLYKIQKKRDICINLERKVAKGERFKLGK